MALYLHTYTCLYVVHKNKYIFILHTYDTHVWAKFRLNCRWQHVAATVLWYFNKKYRISSEWDLCQILTAGFKFEILLAKNKMAVEFERKNVSSNLSYLNPYLKIPCYRSLGRTHTGYWSWRECARIVTTIMTPSIKIALRYYPAIWLNFSFKKSAEAIVLTKRFVSVRSMPLE